MNTIKLNMSKAFPKLFILVLFQTKANITTTIILTIGIANNISIIIHSPKVTSSVPLYTAEFPIELLELIVSSLFLASFNELLQIAQ
ncbi:hypothetical protein AN1V17_22010 [Vallitalea sediminicola]